MKSLLSLVLSCALLVPVLSAAESQFLKSMSAENFSAAGLKKLSAEELALLDRLLAQKEDAQAASTEAEVKAAVSAAQSAAPANVAGPKRPSWITALITLRDTSDQPDSAEAVESRLVGDYDGWSGRTSFKLENGQIWEQVSGGQRIDRKRTAPKVKVYPGLFGVYWLEVEGIRERVKVKPIKLQ